MGVPQNIVGTWGHLTCVAVLGRSLNTPKPGPERRCLQISASHNYLSLSTS